MQATTINEVIKHLDHIIRDSEKTGNRFGYFAALYKMVTVRVREEVEKPAGESMFEDRERMARLDVIFANRYLAAYTEYIHDRPPTKSWRVAFSATRKPSFIVIQHLLLGMNAHINLDLGIAAAQVCRERGQPIEALHHDFNAINTILASLVGTVEQNLSRVWPFLKSVLRIVPFKFDRLITSFSMEVARDKAWAFALRLHAAGDGDLDEMIRARDTKVFIYATRIASPPWWMKIFIFLIRLGEKPSVTENIRYLNGELRAEMAR